MRAANNNPYLNTRAIKLFSKHTIPYLFASVNWSSTPIMIESKGCFKKASIVTIRTLLLPSSKDLVSSANSFPPSSVFPILSNIRANIIPIAIMYIIFLLLMTLLQYSIPTESPTVTIVAARASKQKITYKPKNQRIALKYLFKLDIIIKSMHPPWISAL